MLYIHLRYEADVSALYEEIAGLKALSVVHKTGKTEPTLTWAQPMQPRLRKICVLPGKGGK